MEKNTKIYKVNYIPLNLDLEIFEIPYKVMKSYLDSRKNKKEEKENVIQKNNG